MKVRLLKDLPFVKAGSIGVWKNNSLEFNGHCYNFCKDDIEYNPPWFEILPEDPIWADEEWSVNIYNDNSFTISVKGLNLFSDQIKGRKGLIAKAPDLYRFVKMVADSSEKVDLVVRNEAKKLLNSIENA